MKWTKHGCFYNLNDTDDWRVSHTQLPVIDSSSSDYWRIYFSSRNSDGRSLPCYIDIEPGNPKNIINEQTKPLLELGNAGCFDEHGVMPTAIVDIEDKKYLYYIGWSVKQTVPYQNAIGLAISEDAGVSYRRIGDGPIIGQSPVDPIFTGTFNVLKVGSVCHGYYMSCTEWRSFDDKSIGNSREPRYLLKYASSTDGLHWQRDGHIVISYSDEDEGGIAAASVIAYKDSYKMWYCYRKDHDYRNNKNNSYRIGYATSNDAINWIRDDANAAIDISSDGWDCGMICYPAVVKHNNTLIMFYNGNGFGQSGIGYATCEPL